MPNWELKLDMIYLDNTGVKQIYTKETISPSFPEAISTVEMLELDDLSIEENLLGINVNIGRQA